MSVSVRFKEILMYRFQIYKGVIIQCRKIKKSEIMYNLIITRMCNLIRVWILLTLISNTLDSVMILVLVDFGKMNSSFEINDLLHSLNK